MAKDVIHISEAEAASDFASLMARVRSGAEVIIEDNARPVAVVRPAELYVGLLSEALRFVRGHGSTATLDADFAKDVEAAIESHREPLNPPAWKFPREGAATWSPATDITFDRGTHLAYPST